MHSENFSPINKYNSSPKKYFKMKNDNNIEVILLSKPSVTNSYQKELVK